MSGIHGVAKQAEIKDEQARTLFASILQQVKGGNRVYVKDFGSFFPVTRAARTITSPQIPGGSADVPERKVIRFRPSPATKAVLNGGKHKVAAKKSASAKADKPVK
jgi:nucleoid DNA-binding protein